MKRPALTVRAFIFDLKNFLSNLLLKTENFIQRICSKFHVHSSHFFYVDELLNEH